MSLLVAAAVTHTAAAQRGSGRGAASAAVPRRSSSRSAGTTTFRSRTCSSSTVDEGWVTGGVGSKPGRAAAHRPTAARRGQPCWATPKGASVRSTGYGSSIVRPASSRSSTSGDDDKLLRTTDGNTWKVSGTIPQHNQDYRFFTPRSASRVENRHRPHDRRRAHVDQGVRLPAPATGPGRQRQHVLRGVVVRLRVGHGRLCVRRLARRPGASTSTRRRTRARRGQVSSRNRASWTRREGHVFFKNENAGFACLRTDAILSTEDGGVTWEEVPGPTCHGGAPILFADPEVGWSVEREISRAGRRTAARAGPTADLSGVRASRLLVAAT